MNQQEEQLNSILDLMKDMALKLAIEGIQVKYRHLGQLATHQYLAQALESSYDAHQGRTRQV